MIPALIMSALFMMTAFAFIHAHTKKAMAKEHSASNARVLNEFKRISIYNPEKIVRK